MIVQKIKHVNRKLVFTNHALINVLSVSRWKYNAFVNTRVQNKTPRMTTFVTRKVFFTPWVINDDTAVGGCSTQSWRKLQDINNWILCHHLLTTCKVSVVARQTDSSARSLHASLLFQGRCTFDTTVHTCEQVNLSNSITFLSSKKWIAKKFKSLHPRIYSSFKNENTYQSLYDIQMHIRIDQLLGLGSAPALSIYGALCLRRQ